MTAQVFLFRHEIRGVTFSAAAPFTGTGTVGSHPSGYSTPHDALAAPSIEPPAESARLIFIFKRASS